MMKTCRFLFLLAALLGLSGCPDTPCFSGGVIPAAPLQPSVIIVGEPVRLPVTPQILGGCGESFGDSPTKLEVELSGPDNLLVEHQATLGSPPSSAATIRFTPDKPGRYHVFAAFDPVGGIQQVDLYAARNRSSEALLETLPAACGALERTRRGGWLCDTDFMRDGIVVRSFTGSRIAVAGDVVWVVNERQIQRFVDTGTALEPSATLSHTLGIIEFLLASADELVILHGTTLQRVTFDGTVLATTGPTSWQPGTSPLNPPGPRGILLRSGDHLAVLTALSTPTGPSTVACPYLLAAGRFTRTNATCQTLLGQVVGFEQGVLWLGTPEFFSSNIFSDLRRLEWGANGLVEQASLPLGSNLMLSTHAIGLRTSIVPVVSLAVSAVNPRARGTVAVYSPERRTLLLELLDSEIQEPVASSTLMWGPSFTGGTGPQLRVRIRPTTP